MKVLLMKEKLWDVIGPLVVTIETSNKNINCDD
jgi:hypothetical protein